VGHYSSFILRLWVEPDNRWRWGVIEHVATREKVRFLSPDEILDFIAAHATIDELSLPFTLDGDEPDLLEHGTDPEAEHPEDGLAKEDENVERKT
jgi:hypothetical protein